MPDVAWAVIEPRKTTKNPVFPLMITLAAAKGLSTTFRGQSRHSHQGLAPIFRDLFKLYPQVAVSSQILRFQGNSGVWRACENADPVGPLFSWTWPLPAQEGTLAACA
ncbi:MAG: hypothetical protein J0H45_04910, partial [Stenotrophomonas nitritireducens]|nr:hypothetical protein [Stenotrophomonas nitritireducens]